MATIKHLVKVLVSYFMVVISACLIMFAFIERNHNKPSCDYDDGAKAAMKKQGCTPPVETKHPGMWKQGYNDFDNGVYKK